MSYLLKPLNGGPEISLTREVLVVGRSPRCDVILDQTEFVSRRHCRIITSGERVILNDLGSTNGVYVNRKRIGPFFVLQCGDHVRIGGLKFELLAESAARLAVGAPAGSSHGSSDNWSIPFGILEAPNDETGGQGFHGGSAGREPAGREPAGRDSGRGDNRDRARRREGGGDRRDKSNSPPGGREPRERRTAIESAGVPESQRSSRSSRGSSKRSSSRSGRCERNATSKRHGQKPGELRVGSELKPDSSDDLPRSAAEPRRESGGGKQSSPTGASPLARAINQQGVLPPPSSMFIKTDWASFEQAGTAVQNVTLQCPTCDNEFEWTIERPDKAPIRLTPGICPKCGRDIAPLDDDELQQLLELEQLSPDEDDDELPMSYAAAAAHGLYGVRRRGGGAQWSRVLQSLDFTFLGLLATGFVVSAFFSLVTMGVFGNLLAQIGGVFIPFAQDRPNPEGAELVWKGVATCGVGALPLLLLLTIYNVTDESFLFAMISVIAGVVFSLVIWMGGVISLVPFYFLMLVCLIVTVTALGVATCFAWKIPGPPELPKLSISASVCLFIGAGGLVFALFCAAGSRDHVLGRVPVMPPPWVFCVTYVFLAAGLAAWNCMLEGMSLYFRDPQLYKAIKQNFAFQLVVGLFTIVLLAFSIGMDPDSPLFAATMLLAGLGNSIHLLWFADVVGSSRYLIR